MKTRNVCSTRATQTSVLLAVVCCGLCFAQEDAGTAPKRPEEIGLDSYVSAGKREVVPGVTANASGMTYCADTKTLFVIVDSPAKIVEFTLKGEKKRDIRLSGFFDPEGITHMEGNTFAVIQEGRGTISIISIDDKTRLIKHGDAKEIYVANTRGNVGLEGITYDPKAKTFYVVKEKRSKAIYKVTRDGKVSHPWRAERDSLGLRDMSGIYFEPGTGHLMILSHESWAVVECTTEGREISRLRVRMSKAEGITMDEEGTLYICGEPNFLQRFTKEK